MIRAIIEEHALEAAALFELRQTACHFPDWDLADFLRADERVEAHIDALRIGGRGAAGVVHRALDLGGEGELFVAALLAFESRDGRRIQLVLDVACANPQIAEAVAHAAGWLPRPLAEPPLLEISRSRLAVLRRIALVGGALHRMDLGSQLRAALADSDSTLRARGLWAAGELGVSSLLPAVRVELDADELECRIAACASTWLLGGAEEASSSLRTLVQLPGPHVDSAARIAAATLSLPELTAWSREMAKSGRHRLAAIAAGAAGFAASLPDILSWMREPDAARAAGEAVTMITGLACSDARAELPSSGLGPNEDADDEDVSMHPDQGLITPDPEAMQLACSALELGPEKLLLGHPRTKESLVRIVRSGRQRERWMAARLLATMGPGGALFDVTARAPWQLAALSRLEAS